jgi:hypothetical protein
MGTRSHSRSQLLFTPKQKLIMPQVSFHPLPILKEGEGLEDESATQYEVTINIVNAQNSWTLVQRKKNKKKTKRFNRKVDQAAKTKF